jgi:hypothetical protein
MLQQDRLQHQHHRQARQYGDEPVHQLDWVGNLYLAHYLPRMSLAGQAKAAGIVRLLALPSLTDQRLSEHTWEESFT